MARQRPKPPTPSLPDSVRRAVERTVQSTLGSARSTRGRAHDLVDDATRRAEHQAEAAAAVPERVRGALGDLRFATREELRRLGERIDSLQDRVDRLEGKPPRRRTAAKPASPARAKSGARATAAKPKRQAAKPKGQATAKTRKPAASKARKPPARRTAPRRSNTASKG